LPPFVFLFIYFKNLPSGNAGDLACAYLEQANSSFSPPQASSDGSSDESRVQADDNLVAKFIDMVSDVLEERIGEERRGEERKGGEGTKHANNEQLPFLTLYFSLFLRDLASRRSSRPSSPTTTTKWRASTSS